MRKRMQSVEGLLPFLAEVVAEENRLVAREREVLKAWKVADKWEAGRPEREARAAAKAAQSALSEVEKAAAKEARAVERRDAWLTKREQKRAAKEAELAAERAKWAGYWDGICRYVGGEAKEAA